MRAFNFWDTLRPRATAFRAVLGSGWGRPYVLSYWDGRTLADYFSTSWKRSASGNHARRQLWGDE